MFLFYFWPFDQNIFLHHSWCSDLCNYKKHDLASLNSDGDKLDVNKSEKWYCSNDAVKKIVYDELVKKVITIHIIDASKLVKKLIMTQKLKKVKWKYLIMINVLLSKRYKRLTYYISLITINDFKKFSGIIFDERLYNIWRKNLRS